MLRRTCLPLLVAAFVEVAQSVCYDTAGNFSKDLWIHCQPVQQANADVYYTATADGFLQIGVHAKNVKGWSGLGFGGNGGMKGMQSVIVRQDVDNKKWIAEERFSLWYETPKMNPTQMVKLMYAREDSAGVTWAVLLPTATCDEGAAERYTVEDLTRWMQFASGGGHDFLYHAFRTQFVANLRAPPPSEFDGASMPIMNVTKEAISIPNETNPYTCIYFDVSQITVDGMLLENESYPIVGAMRAYLHGPSSPYVHHIVMFNCAGSATDPPTHHYEEDHCEGMPQKCDLSDLNMIWAWAKGGTPIDLASKDVGLPLVNPWLAMQMHYYNPNMVPGVQDASGVYFYISQTVPANLAGTITFNSGSLPLQLNAAVPNLTSHYTSEVMYVGSDCLNTMFPIRDAGKINIISLAHHLHIVGTKQEIIISRDGVNLGPIRDEKAYDFNFQSYEETRLKTFDPAKDTIASFCHYNTLKSPTNYRNEPVTFGEQTTTEMCYATMLYWPKQDGPTNLLWFQDYVTRPFPEGKTGVYGCGGAPYKPQSIQANPTAPQLWEYSDIKYDSIAWKNSAPAACSPIGDLTSSKATDLIAKLMQSSSAVGGDDGGCLSSGLHSLPLLFILVASTSGL